MTKRRESPEQCDHSLLIGLQVAYPVEKNFCARLSAFCNVWSDLFRGESIGSASHTQHHTQLVQQPMNSKFAAASDQLLIAAPGLNGPQLELGDVSCNTPERLIVVSKSIRGADPSAAENPSAPSLDASPELVQAFQLIYAEKDSAAHKPLTDHWLLSAHLLNCALSCQWFTVLCRTA
ncbi:hypothetical protein L207DRAFT_204045 [Hyaloscypha variabilis F]|uniref:Uncharacterized protein n=1 Tax=Hyaloscypha variabilis (strain UAMH 11265 / GT02V1 / F) TaxID=1149755 RepID=A0A2J6S592_HYAVF|nr:hypothetical protein L207DRAFT_204045 [Hyaloscypha variabilis F]